mgnify:CR=1 FL=1
MLRIAAEVEFFACPRIVKFWPDFIFIHLFQYFLVGKNWHTSSQSCSFTLAHINSQGNWHVEKRQQNQTTTLAGIIRTISKDIKCLVRPVCSTFIEPCPGRGGGNQHKRQVLWKIENSTLPTLSPIWILFLAEFFSHVLVSVIWKNQIIQFSKESLSKAIMASTRSEDSVVFHFQKMGSLLKIGTLKIRKIRSVNVWSNKKFIWLSGMLSPVSWCSLSASSICG